MKQNQLTASEINGNKEKEIELIKQLFALDGYFADAFKGDDWQIEQNILMDFEFTFGTKHREASESAVLKEVDFINISKIAEKYESNENTGLKAIPQLFSLLLEFGYNVKGVKLSNFISCSDHTEIHKFRGIRIMASKSDLECFAKGSIKTYPVFAYFRERCYDLIF